MKKKLLLIAMIFMFALTPLMQAKQAEASTLKASICANISPISFDPYLKVKIDSQVTAYIYLTSVGVNVLVFEQTISGFDVTVNGSATLDATSLQLALNLIADMPTDLTDGMVFHFVLGAGLSWDSVTGIGTSLAISPFITVPLDNNLTLKAGLAGFIIPYAILTYTTDAFIASVTITLGIAASVEVPIFETQVDLLRAAPQEVPEGLTTTTEILSRGSTDLSADDIEEIKAELISAFGN